MFLKHFAIPIFTFEMAKEILLYNYIVDESVRDIIERIEDSDGGEVEMRINSGGGSVFSGWGVPAKMQEHGKVKIKVDGIAASMAAIYCLFAESVECLDVSRFMLHRASLDNNDNPDAVTMVNNVNRDLKSKMKARLDADKFKEITGKTIDQMFESDIDLWFNAKEAKAIGLVGKINKLNTVELKAMNEVFYKIAATLKPENPTNMTAAELKASFPNVYNEIFNAGVTAGFKDGTEQEKDRVEAALVYNEIDPKAVKEIIESGKPMSHKQMAEFSLKASTSMKALETLSEEGKKNKVETSATSTQEKTEKEKVLAGLEAELMAKLNVTGKTVNKSSAYRKYATV